MDNSEGTREKLLAEIQGLKSRFEQLKSMYEKDNLIRRETEQELLIRTKLLSAFNKYSIELEEQTEDKIQKFIVTSFKSLFEVRVVWISSYDEKNSELVVENSTASDDETSLILKYLGLAMRAHRTAISEAQYMMMVESGTKVFSSLHEISFGQIPKMAGSAIEKLFNVGWFQGVALTNKGKLFGTLVIAGSKGQEELPGDVVKIFADITSNILRRKRVEEALLKSKEQYDVLVSKIPVGVYILRSSPENTFALDYVSPRMAEMLDSSVEELLSDASRIYEKIYPDDRNSFIKLNLEGIKRSQPFYWSGRVKYKGTIKWLHISSAPELQKNGDFLWHGIVVDITGQKQAENSLIESERLLRETQKIARLGSFVWDLSSGLWKSSGILDEIFGIDENYIRSFDGWVNIVHPDFRNVMTDYVTKEVIGKHLKFDKEYRIIRKANGQDRWVHGLGELEIDNDNKPVKLIGTIIDITDRKEAEDEIRKISKHYQALIEKAPDGIIQLDAAGNFKYASPSARKMFGYSSSQKININPTEQIHPDDLAEVSSELEKLLQDPDYTPTLQYRFSDIKGDWLWVESTFSNLLGDPSVESIVINFREITDRKKVENEVNQLNISLEERVNERTAQLEDANKELQAFAYSVSHDLRAPLRAIDGFSKYVLEDYGQALDSEGQRLLGLIRSNTQKMDKLITDILSLSRVTRGEHKKSVIDMTKMAMSMLNEAASPEILEKLEFTIEPLPLTNADPTFIKQVWINLISNAIKFSSLKMKPEIKIGGYKENNYNVYFISDNGVGFNPEYAHKLFGVFQRLHKADEFEGTGVGLAIVQRIIHRHGGKVWAESKEGRGATFYFSLPLSI